MSRSSREMEAPHIVTPSYILAASAARGTISNYDCYDVPDEDEVAASVMMKSNYEHVDANVEFEESFELDGYASGRSSRHYDDEDIDEEEAEARRQRNVDHVLLMSSLDETSTSTKPIVSPQASTMTRDGYDITRDGRMGIASSSSSHDVISSVREPLVAASASAKHMRDRGASGTASSMADNHFNKSGEVRVPVADTDDGYITGYDQQKFSHLKADKARGTHAQKQSMSNAVVVRSARRHVGTDGDYDDSDERDTLVSSLSSSTAFGDTDSVAPSDEARAQAHQDAVGELYARLTQVTRANPMLVSTVLANLARNDTTLVDRAHRLLDHVTIASGIADAPFKSRVRRPKKIERNWNAEFQRCQRALRDEDVGENRDKLVRLRNLANDFVSVAEHYGRIIISERYLPVGEKTIKPVSVGGVAGGDKYIAQGVLFKFAVDRPLQQKEGVTWMYGTDEPSDENAMRVAGNELRGLISYFRSAPPGLHVPLMCLIDYRGFRLIAASLLPLAPHTLCYGSHDGGATVHNSDPELERYMRIVAGEVNLKGHIVKDQRLYACGDIEGHKGSDGKFYVLDFARVFPPEAPQRDKSARSIFHNLLRPELVKSHSVPLSSDAFSRFQQHDPRDKQLNGQVRLATRRLFNVVIPKWAKNLGKPSVTRLIEDVHAAGINVRHLGRCRAAVPSKEPEHRVLLLTEMTARVVKNIVRFNLREGMRRHRIPSLAVDRKIVLDILNLVFGSHSETNNYWCSTETEMWHNGRCYPSLKCSVMRKFEMALTEEEQNVGFDLRWRIDMKLMYERLQQMTSITLSRRVLLEYGQNSTTFEITDGDLQNIGVRVKHMNIVGLTTAVVLRLEAAQQTDINEFRRIFKLAEHTFTSTLASVPDNALTWHEWGKLLYEKAKRTGILDVYEEAIEKFKAAEQHGATADDQVRTHSTVLLEYALTLLHEGRQLKINSVANQPQVVDIANPEDWRESHRRFEQVAQATAEVIKKMEDDATDKLADAMIRTPELVSVLLEEARRMYAEGLAIEQVLGTMLPLTTSTSFDEDFLDSVTMSGEMPVSNPNTPRTPRGAALGRATMGLASSAPVMIGDVSVLAARAGAPNRAATPPSSAIGLRKTSLRDSTGIPMPLSTTPPSALSGMPFRDSNVHTHVETSKSGSENNSNKMEEAAANATTTTTTTTTTNTTTITTTTTTTTATTTTSTKENNTNAQNILESSERLNESTEMSQDPSASGLAARLALRRAMRNARTKSREMSTTISGKGGMALLMALLHNCAQLLRVCVTAAELLDDKNMLARVRAFLSEVLLRTGMIDLQQMNLRKFQGCYDVIARVAQRCEEGISNDPTQLNQLSNLIATAEDEEFLAYFCVYLSCPLMELPVIQRCATLVRIDMRHLSGIPEGAFLTLFRECQNLEWLSLRECWQVTNGTLEELATNGSQLLRVLDLHGCHKIGDVGVAALAKYKTSLVELDVSACDRVSDISMLLIAQHLELKRFECAATKGIQSLITDMAITELAQHSGEKLKSLNVSCCDRVTDRSLAELAKHCPNLRELRVERFTRAWEVHKPVVTEKGLLALMKSCTKLEYLDVSGARGVTKRWLESKKNKHLPNCEVRYVEQVD